MPTVDYGRLIRKRSMSCEGLRLRMVPKAVCLCRLLMPDQSGVTKVNRPDVKFDERRLGPLTRDRR